MSHCAPSIATSEAWLLVLVSATLRLARLPGIHQPLVLHIFLLLSAPLFVVVPLLFWLCLQPSAEHSLLTLREPLLCTFLASIFGSTSLAARCCRVRARCCRVRASCCSFSCFCSCPLGCICFDGIKRCLGCNLCFGLN